MPPDGFLRLPDARRLPDYGRYDQLDVYFEDCAEHFGFRHKVTFNMTVTAVTRADGGGWQVRTHRSESRHASTTP